MNRLILLAAMLAGISPAHAALTLCNRTGTILYAATAAVVDLDAGAQGWLRLAPGECAVARKELLGHGPYLVYARTSLAYPGPAHAWGGDVQLCVKDTDFSVRETAGSNLCAEGMFPLPFSRLQNHGERDWTMSFDEQPALASLTAAQLVGVKRLLAINGLRVGALDAIPDSQTGAALALFRKRMRFAPDAGNSELFAALETEALKTSAPSGYTVCNDSAESFAVALAQTVKSGAVSRGWWMVPAGGCAKAITAPLHDDVVYVLAQRKNGQVVVGGPMTFCITTIAFEVQGRAHCGARGMAEAGFAATRTKGMAGYVAHIGGNGIIAPLSSHTIGKDP